MRKPWLVPLWAVVIGCSSTSTETSTDEIRGGRAESGYPEVGVLLVARELRCTGTLIARDWVLTAAHCADRETPTEFVVGGRSYGVATFRAHPSYRREAPGIPFAGADLAVVRLEQAVPDVAPASLSALDDVATRKDLLVRSVGFGEDDQRESGAKRSAMEWINWIGDVDFTTVAVSGTTRPGDSGGPVYLGRSVVGVTSRGLGPSFSVNAGAAREWLDATTRGQIAWIPLELTTDPEAPHELCERATVGICTSAGVDAGPARERVYDSCIEAYARCGQPPAYAACLSNASSCKDRERCEMLPTHLCFTDAPPATWDDAVRENACDVYAQARLACEGGRLEPHRSECARRFDACNGRLPEAVRCEIRERASCEPMDCLARTRCGS